MTGSGRHPAPPRGGHTGPLAIQRVRKNHTWFRLYRHQYDPLHFGMTRRSRFDAPNGEFGVLYVARQCAGAFIETLVRDGIRELPNDVIKRFHVAEITASRGLKLIDLAGKGLVRMGVDGRLATGDYRIAQRWSKVFYDHPDGVDGILYPSRHDPKQHLAALFDRTHPLLRGESCGTVRNYLGDQEFFRLLDHYGIALL